MMKTVLENEYNVLVTPPPVNGSNGHAGDWQASVIGLPDIAEKAGSREQVLQQIQNRLAEIMRHSEIVSLTVPTSSVLPTAEKEDRLRALGWDDHGLFKDDPEALKLFDEIEEERNRHWVGGE